MTSVYASLRGQEEARSSNYFQSPASVASVARAVRLSGARSFDYSFVQQAPLMN
jgi:hypothetical protein